MSSSRHGGSHTFAFLHVEIPDQILGVLGLRHERTFSQLFDLQSKEELQFTHHGHLGTSLTSAFQTFH